MRILVFPSITFYIKRFKDKTPVWLRLECTQAVFVVLWQTP